ncbi:hypothetical protein EIP91_000402 [Steccherinum ochraceum]|uniref:Uncharacterized protein n=1 Tax=Steccherinum ochraceum TaxID=92696 RepID=A0A4R0RI90_9APHY|nr:hypothetical protein EIP91_000402 [Steccherinum ochraceum]
MFSCVEQLYLSSVVVCDVKQNFYGIREEAKKVSSAFKIHRIHLDCEHEDRTMKAASKLLSHSRALDELQSLQADEKVQRINEFLTVASPTLRHLDLAVANVKVLKPTFRYDVASPEVTTAELNVLVDAFMQCPAHVPYLTFHLKYNYDDTSYSTMDLLSVDWTALDANLSRRPALIKVLFKLENANEEDELDEEDMELEGIDKDIEILKQRLSRTHARGVLVFEKIGPLDDLNDS